MTAALLPFRQPRTPVTQAVTLMLRASLAEDHARAEQLRRQAHDLATWCGGWGRNEPPKDFVA